MLPATFKFSQSSLQDYVDCARRFQLRYVDSQAWPGVLAEPLLEHEWHVERGAVFHRLIQRHQLGVSESVLTAGISDPDLLAWWRAYLGFDFLHRLGGRRYPEYTMSARLGGAVVVATFDLLVVVPGERVVVFDWKTYARQPSRQWVEARLQTRVYPCVVCSSGAGLFGGELRPEQVSMVYWVSGAPDEVLFVEYGAVRFERDQLYILGLVSEICGGLIGGVWSLTADVGRCRFCEYRSLCGRGGVAGVLGGSNDLGNIGGEGLVVLGLLGVGESAV
jgi:hypothetical protein